MAFLHDMKRKDNFSRSYKATRGRGRNINQAKSLFEDCSTNVKTRLSHNSKASLLQEKPYEQSIP